MEADIQKALEASRAERKARDNWRSRYADLERQIEELSPSAPAQPSSNAVLFAAILTGLGGLIAGIALGTTYIAPTL